jgi:hypothetical protein
MEYKKHESYGMLEINRQTSSGAIPLFGSSIKHSNLISLKVKTASVKRDLNREWIHGEDTVVEVLMSYSQFTQAIMSFNTTGTPVTISRLNGKSIENDFTKESTRDTFSKEFQEIINKVLGNAAKSAKQAEQLLSSSKPMNKEQREDIKSMLYKIHQDIASNMKFVNECFNKQMDATITEAKGEVEAFVENKVRSFGLEAMQNQLHNVVAIEMQQDEMPLILE